MDGVDRQIDFALADLADSDGDGIYDYIERTSPCLDPSDENTQGGGQFITIKAGGKAAIIYLE